MPRQRGRLLALLLVLAGCVVCGWFLYVQRDYLVGASATYCWRLDRKPLPR